MVPAAREALLLLIAGAGLGLGGNALRSEPLPFRAPPEAASPPDPSASIEGTPAPDAADAWRQGAYFLDIRPDAEFESRRVAGALPFPADRAEDLYYETLMDFGPDMPFVVYGAGPDSFEVRRVTQFLRDLGHTDVRCVVEGVDSLVGAGIDPGDGPAEAMW